jgi:hypothetical protein
MPKYKSNKPLRNWLKSKSVVAAGYFDEVKGVNLEFLLASWVDTTEEYKESFADNYPSAADYFQVAVVDKDDPRLEQPGILLRVLRDFRYCQHLKVRSDGELMNREEVAEIIERTTDRFYLEPLESAPWD